MLGRGGMYVEECVRDGYIGVDFNIYKDLSAALPENWREFNKQYIPVFMVANPDKAKWLLDYLVVCYGLYTKGCK